jgi:hypothetical protein
LITIVFKNLKANALAFGKNRSSAIVYEINSRKDAKAQRLGQFLCAFASLREFDLQTQLQ